MTPKEYGSYVQRGIVGVSVTVAPPIGQYDSAKLINLGTHRWSIKPERGLPPPSGSWALVTDTNNLFGGRTREQDPIVATQVHVTYKFKRTMWLAGDANFYTGGQTTIDGKLNLDFQRNSRVGSTFSTALDRHQAIRMSVSRGAYTTIGANFLSIAASYSYAWVR